MVLRPVLAAAYAGSPSAVLVVLRLEARLMARTKAQRDRDREDLLLAIDELGDKATIYRLALAMDSTASLVERDLLPMERAGLVAFAQVNGQWIWVRADSLEADAQADVDDITRQQLSWEVAQ